MLNLSDINFRPESRILRQFAAAWLVVLGGAGTWKLLTRTPTTGNYVLAIAGLAIGLMGLAAPKLIRPIYAGAMLAAFPIGFVVSRVLLAAVYFLVMTPIGAAMRIGRRDRLRIGRPKQGDTYWVARTQQDDMSRYLRQY